MTRLDQSDEAVEPLVADWTHWRSQRSDRWIVETGWDGAQGPDGIEWIETFVRFSDGTLLEVRGVDPALIITQMRRLLTAADCVRRESAAR